MTNTNGSVFRCITTLISFCTFTGQERFVSHPAGFKDYSPGNKKTPTGMAGVFTNWNKILLTSKIIIHN